MRTNTRVNAICVREDKVLLIHRRKEGHEYYVFPGGGVEEGESEEEAVVREVREETDLEVLKVRHLFNASDEDGRSDPYFEVQVGEGKPRLSTSAPESSNEANWYNPEWVETAKLPQITVYPAGGFMKFMAMLRAGEIG